MFSRLSKPLFKTYQRLRLRLAVGHATRSEVLNPDSRFPIPDSRFPIPDSLTN
ncbi:MAG: hypothetical protein F6K63_12300 [Moorea sp. SIO1G6]|uniref:hypothetical protein n=1 Tax=Moorena sp. SIO1G6 TaxID=2607840 RepID=UPI0013C1CAB0|nr:hypothetical protein [Moorena sp. SIO1G6]NET65119.1 hypothetical protein [Moorena sp. SIO1G6]